MNQPQASPIQDGCDHLPLAGRSVSRFISKTRSGPDKRVSICLPVRQRFYQVLNCPSYRMCEQYLVLFQIVTNYPGIPSTVSSFRHDFCHYYIRTSSDWNSGRKTRKTPSVGYRKLLKTQTLNLIQRGNFPWIVTD